MADVTTTLTLETVWDSSARVDASAAAKSVFVTRPPNAVVRWAITDATTAPTISVDDGHVMERFQENFTLAAGEYLWLAHPQGQITVSITQGATV